MLLVHPVHGTHGVKFIPAHLSSAVTGTVGAAPAGPPPRLRPIGVRLRNAAWPWSAAWLVAAGCGFQSRALLATSGDVGDTAGSDTDAASSPGGPTVCAWASHFDTCMLPPVPAGPLTLTRATVWRFDTHGAGGFGTSTPPGSAPPAGTFAIKTMHQVNGGPDVVVLYTLAFTLEAGATLDVVGDKPLVIASSSTLQIDGLLDAGSQTGAGAGARGPGANFAGCAAALDGAATNDGGGGGGGALGADGGGGGGGNGSNGGPRGRAIAAPGYLRGGCAGGSGGRGGPGPGGAGGGAIELAARGSIVVTGQVNAGGGGGPGGVRGSQKMGGGGGGSGGLISLDSPTVTLASTAVIAANGGGGGGGSDNASGGPGGDATLSAANAAGGTSDSDGTGGAGGASSRVSGETGGSTDSGGGGGGGGGVGFVVVHAGTFVTMAALVSPPAVQP